MNSTAKFSGNNAGVQVGQNDGQITCNYFNQPADSKVINPELDKMRIEEEKGGLLRDSYRWVLNHDDFKKWKNTTDGQLLWIKGQAGKGKTMLICGIIDELSSTAVQDNVNIAYFFCQATNNRINSATAVLRGLIYMLGKQQPLLQAHVPASFPNNENEWFMLCGVFREILRDSAMKTTHFLIDALDECTIDQERLLKFLEEHSTGYSRVKWIVSSRNLLRIEEYLDNTAGIRLQLELNEHNLSAAVSSFIDYKVEKLRYTPENKKTVHDHLTKNAQGTFLWVALVCKQLKDVRPRHLQKRLKDFPPGLDEFYGRMLSFIQNKDDDTELCLSLLGIVTTVYRPITLDELSLYLDSQDELTSDDLQEIVKLCGSFLTLQTCTITLIHQSAQDFLSKHLFKTTPPNGIQEIHYSIFSKSLESVHANLKRDIYNLGNDTVSISEVKQPEPDPLATMRYACLFWVDHLNDYFRNNETSEQIQDTMLLDTFLRQDLLHWLEALSLIRNLPEGAKSMLTLEGLLKARARDTELIPRVQDAYRFIIYHKAMLEDYPFQVYTSATFFTPLASMTRTQFEPKDLSWISGKHIVEESWSACLQTLRGHEDWVNSVVFSPDSTQVASASDDETVKLWDTSSGECLQTLRGHEGWVNSVVFSPDSTQVASASDDETVKLWDTSSGECLQTLNDYGDSIIIFDTINSCLQTNRGIFTLPFPTNLGSSQKGLEEPYSEGFGLSSDRTWITWKSVNLLKLPLVHNVSAVTFARSTICIGFQSGRFLILKSD
ncbi:WD40 repeat-like protein [Penicillium taxi]|uniref:WD40 repeat-like protein n=1 Tax=Penicillium taxi TaxID=168475 RepID=UPI002545A8BA|nr:WD40 repeat-like protein [Penicillium taxi]KAJ5901617.1 WD40 repeat-like protein [Penicillium taxi]